MGTGVEARTRFLERWIKDVSKEEFNRAYEELRLLLNWCMVDETGRQPAWGHRDLPVNCFDLSQGAAADCRPLSTVIQYVEGPDALYFPERHDTAAPLAHQWTKVIRRARRYSEKEREVMYKDLRMLEAMCAPPSPQRLFLVPCYVIPSLDCDTD